VVRARAQRLAIVSSSPTICFKVHVVSVTLAGAVFTERRWPAFRLQIEPKNCASSSYSREKAVLRGAGGSRTSSDPIPRHTPDWQSVVQHKADALKIAIDVVALGPQVDVCRLHITGWESNTIPAGNLMHDTIRTARDPAQVIWR